LPLASAWGDDLRKRRLAGALYNQIRPLHQFIDREYRRWVSQGRGKFLGKGAFWVRDTCKHGPGPPTIERTSQRPPNRSYAEDTYSQRDARLAHASSSMRSMARLALRAIWGGTCTRGDSVSSESIILSSVIVFMKAQIAFGFTG
jgi:hypothetical protein